MSKFLRQDNTQAPGTAPAHTIHGSAVTDTLRVESVNPGTQQVVQSTFRDYQPPKRRAHDQGHRICSEPDCKAYPSSEDKNYCHGHGRKHGEQPVCAKDGCGSPPKKDQQHCRWHVPKAVTSESD